MEVTPYLSPKYEGPKIEFLILQSMSDEVGFKYVKRAFRRVEVSNPDVFLRIGIADPLLKA
jgi:hypothetical protein